MIELRTAPAAILIETGKTHDSVQLIPPDKCFIVVVVQSVEGCRGELKLAQTC